MFVRRLPTWVLLILVLASSLWTSVRIVQAAALGSAPLTANQRFVTQAYLDVLHRSVDTSALTAFVGCLDASTCSRVGFANTAVTSTEYRSDVCRQFYLHLLDRLPTTGEMNTCVGQLQSGVTNEGEITVLVAGNEYFSSRAGNSNTGYVQALYADLLGRAADSSALTNYRGCLDAGFCNRTDVANNILTSTEYYSDVCSEMYNRLLHRSPGFDLSGCVTSLQNGVTDEQYIAQIVGSNEYFAKLPSGVAAAEGPFTRFLGTFTTGISGATAADYTASITWGDGTTSTGTAIAWNSGAFYVQGNHTYDEEGAYSADVTINGPKGTSTSFTTSVSAVDAPLTAVATRRSSSYSTFGVVATFSDADPKGIVADYSATIDWGDGTASSVGIVAGTGPFTVSGAHSYSTSGIYPVQVTIVDVGGAATEVIGAEYVNTPFGGPTWTSNVRLRARAVPRGVRLSWSMRATPSVAAYRLVHFRRGGKELSTARLLHASGFLDRTGHSGDRYHLQLLDRRGQVLGAVDAIARR